MFPARLSFVTYNIWRTERWTLREPALLKFLEIFDPDVLCLQELVRTTRDAIDRAMPAHRRVEDDFPGWTNESNIYWRAAVVDEIEHGAEDVGLKLGERRLFWVRLRLKSHDRSLLVATAHLTHQRHRDETATGHSPRIDETKRIIAALARLTAEREPTFFMGDLNDPVHPTRLLHEAGFASCFAALGLQCPPTFKCYPTVNLSPGEPVTNQTVDWLVANRETRIVAASVPNFYFRDAAPSDHWPVHAVYEIAATAERLLS